MEDFLLRLHAMVVAGWLAIAALGVFVTLKLGRQLRPGMRRLNIN